MLRLATVTFLALSTLGALGSDPARAAEFCQNRRTGQMSWQTRCVGKYRPAWIYNDLQARIAAVGASNAAALGELRQAFGSDLDARQASVVRDLEAFKKRLEAQSAQLQGQLEDGFAAIVLLNARFPVAGADIRDGAVTGGKVQDGSLELADLAVPVMLPHAGAAPTEDWRVVTAELDLDGIDQDTVGVEHGDDWLALSLLNVPAATVEFTIAEGSFAGRPRCLGSLSQSGSPDAAQNLEVQVVGDDRLRVRVVGTDRRLNVQGTVLCAGVAGAL